MTPLDEKPQESDVSALELQALQAAIVAFQAAGHPRIVVQN